MDFNLYAAEHIARERIAALRAHTARLALLKTARPARTRRTSRLAAVLVRIGHRLVPGDPVRARNAAVRVGR